MVCRFWKSQLKFFFENYVKNPDIAENVPKYRKVNYEFKYAYQINLK